MFSFDVIKTSANSRARIGRITTPHGCIDTPAFIFCATKANIKGVTIDQVANAGTQVILSNTYHMMLQPGAEVVATNGGLHKFIGWNKPMLTDSGGFQVFSLGYGGVVSEIKGQSNKPRRNSVIEITDDGVVFRSYITGNLVQLTPEISMQVQQALGADLVVAFDECTAFHVSKVYTANAMEKSKQWGLRSLRYIQTYGGDRQAVMGVVQGGVYNDLRQSSAAFVNENDFFGFAIGGSLGQTQQQMYEVVDFTTELLDHKRCKHLLGIGLLEDIFHGVLYGIDTFDCVVPTRVARHNAAILPKSEVPDNKRYLNLADKRYAKDTSPLCSSCECYTCKNFTKSYLHHLIKAHETLSGTLLTIHNIYTMNRVMSDIRNAILNDTLESTKKYWCG